MRRTGNNYSGARWAFARARRPAPPPPEPKPEGTEATEGTTEGAGIAPAPSPRGLAAHYRCAACDVSGEGPACWNCGATDVERHRFPTAGVPPVTPGEVLTETASPETSGRLFDDEF